MNNKWSKFALGIFGVILFAGVAYLFLKEGDLPGGPAPLSASVLSSFSDHFEGVRRAIEPKDVLYFNPSKNSGWIYVAQTEPLRGKLFWAAAIRSMSTDQTDNSAQLMYGITDVVSKKHYSGFIDGGSLREDPDKVNIVFSKDGREIFRLVQQGSGYKSLSLMVDLPYEEKRHKVAQLLSITLPMLYEGGDGIISMGSGIKSLYASLVPTQKYWIDFQKFNMSSLNLSPKSLNHRWMSFRLDARAGDLPAGTIGVGWEILGPDNERRPGYTNIDLLVPGHGQLTANEAQINSLVIDEIETWRGRGKEYLKKWKVNYSGISLLFETTTPNQENSVMGNYFYEGALNVLDPVTGKKIGSGMLEQTHNEASSK